MKRRDVLRGMAAAAVSTVAWPHFLREAFGETACERPVSVVGDALARARALGKPLVVLVIPANDGLKNQRGDLFGWFFANATPEQLWPLSLGEVVCATMAEAQRDTGFKPTALQKLGDEPVLILFEPPQGSEPTFWDIQETTHGWDDAAVDRAVGAAASLFAAALTRDPAMLKRRAAECKAKLTADEVKALEAPREGDPRLDGELVWRGAALLALHPDPKWRERISKSVEARLRTHAPPGSRWATAGGCGVHVDGDDPTKGPMVGCGMGMISAKGRRFLWLFAKTPNQEWEEQQKKGR